MSEIELINPQSGNMRVENTDSLYDNEHSFKKENGVRKFVKSEGYTSNFGLQWKQLKKTLPDKFSGLSYSNDRFFAASVWSEEKLKEWVILDTFDMFSPEFDQPQKISNVKKHFETNGLKVQFAGYRI